eukprot:CAMPEP_0116896550 /NCGR_PEP_ID=MMETSP0467-20121206/5764_1 /TAXON_ID=283647 /ORGANISM="Mesodinium pulex, Strain SPMC105" /LENGTH=47 /DNA_ID= /DNA_START= /DNA_END= /DNA_ORIENTATION=
MVPSVNLNITWYYENTYMPKVYKPSIFLKKLLVVDNVLKDASVEGND